MKGIVFNVLQSVVTDEYGEETWETLLDGAGLEGAYTAVGSYADEELVAILKVASSALGTPTDDLLRWFGRKAIPVFAERYPHFFEGHGSARSFVLTLNDIIHPEVRKLYPGADVPVFDFEEDGDTLRIGYRSMRKMCALAEGLLTGAADRFGETVTVTQSECMNRGDDRCVLVSTFARA